MATVTIPARFNGPPRSANGGYACGAIAAHLDGPVRVTLHAPPPLDRPLDVRPSPAGSIEVVDGDAVIATATLLQVPVAFDLPYVVSLEEAADAVDDYLGWDQHLFPTCFVCGPDRGDGLRLFTGPVDDGIVASPWLPDRSLDRGDGSVAEVFVWAALDCPGYFGGPAPRPALLGNLTTTQRAPVVIGEPHVVVGWRLDDDGRRFRTGSAILTPQGSVLAIGEAHWVEVSADVLETFQ